jgi:hypothetical protein
LCVPPRLVPRTNEREHLQKSDPKICGNSFMVLKAAATVGCDGARD